MFTRVKYQLRPGNSKHMANPKQMSSKKSSTVLWWEILFFPFFPSYALFDISVRYKLHLARNYLAWFQPYAIESRSVKIPQINCVQGGDLRIYFCARFSWHGNSFSTPCLTYQALGWSREIWQGHLSSHNILWELSHEAIPEPGKQALCLTWKVRMIVQGNSRGVVCIFAYMCHSRNITPTQDIVAVVVVEEKQLWYGTM